jgi:hypothetical protein
MNPPTPGLPVRNAGLKLKADDFAAAASPDNIINNGKDQHGN